jgi:hypothetical protein
VSAPRGSITLGELRSASSPHGRPASTTSTAAPSAWRGMPRGRGASGPAKNGKAPREGGALPAGWDAEVSRNLNYRNSYSFFPPAASVMLPTNTSHAACSPLSRPTARLCRARLPMPSRQPLLAPNARRGRSMLRQEQA